MRLMIVDDSNMIRSRISKVVQGGTVKGIVLVGLARNGQEALRIARATNPDVVTMDLTMPEMGGLECISLLVKAHPKLSILVVSALDDKSSAIAALKAGARGFVAKPFSDEALQVALLELLDNEAL